MRRASSRGSDSGFTLLEVLISSALGVALVAAGLCSMDIVRYVYLHEVVRTRVDQDLRSATDMIGTALRQAGEGFTSAFPAIEVVDGASGAPDEVTLRWEFLTEEPTLCATINAGSARGNVYFTSTTTTPGCAYGSNAANYNAWRSYLTSEGSPALGYIYNSSTRRGEFFPFTDVRNASGSYFIVPTAGTWTNSYTVSATASTSQLYILDEWRYRLQGDELQLIANNGTSDPWEVAYNISNMQVRVLMNDGTTLNSFTRNDDWTQIRAVELSLTGSDTFAKRTITSTVTSRYFPRNVLSN